MRSLITQKMVVPETKVLDSAGGRVRAIVSTEVVDRDGDIIRVAGWVLDNFLKHPVLISSHNYGSLRSVIGEWESMEVKQRPARLEGVAKYYIGDGNEEADWAFKLVERGRAAYSVGFRPDMDKATERPGPGLFGSWEYNGQELLEVSHVAIPANPEALQALKGLMEQNGKTDPLLLGLVVAALKDCPCPVEPLPEPLLPLRQWFDEAFTKAYQEVYPW